MRKYRFALAGCILFSMLLAVVTMVAHNVTGKQRADEAAVIAQIPWDRVNGIIEELEQEDPNARVSFYSSKGCSELDCDDFSSHTHWCAENCMDREHGHSEAEYTRSKAAIRQLDPTPVYLRK